MNLEAEVGMSDTSGIHESSLERELPLLSQHQKLGASPKTQPGFYNIPPGSRPFSAPVKNASDKTTWISVVI